MQVETTRFGTLSINDDEQIFFPEGLLGLSELRRFTLIPHPNGPFQWLQSLEEPDVAFPTLDPRLIDDDYKVELNNSDFMCMAVDQQETCEVVFLCIINASNPARPTINMMAPLCIAVDTCTGIQIVQHNQNLDTRHPLRRRNASSTPQGQDAGRRVA